jgi:hypothetical protein
MMFWDVGIGVVGRALTKDSSSWSEMAFSCGGVAIVTSPESRN